MRLGLRWTEQAVDQLSAMVEYISLSSPVYAEQVLERIVLRLRQAQQFPESGRRVPESGHADARELFEPPYRIVYRVRSDTVEVLTIVHGRQDLPSQTPS